MRLRTPAPPPRTSRLGIIRDAVEITTKGSAALMIDRLTNSYGTKKVRDVDAPISDRQASYLAALVAQEGGAALLHYRDNAIIVIVADSIQSIAHYVEDSS